MLESSKFYLTIITVLLIGILAYSYATRFDYIKRCSIACGNDQISVAHEEYCICKPANGLVRVVDFK